MKIVDVSMEFPSMGPPLPRPAHPPAMFECALDDAIATPEADPGDEALDGAIREIIVRGLIELSRERREDRIRLEMRVVVMSEMGLAERDLACMPRETCRAVDEEIDRRVEQRLRIEIEQSVDNGWVRSYSAGILLAELDHPASECDG